LNQKRDVGCLRTISRSERLARDHLDLALQRLGGAPGQPLEPTFMVNLPPAPGWAQSSSSGRHRSPGGAAAASNPIMLIGRSSARSANGKVAAASVRIA